MDSAKIFALGLAGLTIHVVLRSKARQAKNEIAGADTNSKAHGSIASKSSKKSKNKKKSKDVAAPASAPEPKKVEVDKKPAAIVKAEEPAPSQTASSKKKNKNKKQTQPAPAPAVNEAQDGETYAAVAETTPAINNETIRAKADAAQVAFTSSLGDMRDTDVDPLPAGYSSVARIPAAEAAAPKPKLSKKDLDDGWSSVGGTFPSSSASSTAAAKTNGTTTTGTASKSIASTNPFAALPDDAATSSVRRLPAKPAKPTNTNGWTTASSTPKRAVNGGTVETETKKQRSNANKTQAKKAAKEEADRLQAERLASHRRQQAVEAAKAREVAKRPTPQSVPGAGKQTSAKASVDLNGRLVWD